MPFSPAGDRRYKGDLILAGLVAAWPDMAREISNPGESGIYFPRFSIIIAVGYNVGIGNQ